jgi:hypothetical protein
MSFAATTMALVPSVASARNLSFRSIWFWSAIGIFFLILLLGLRARHYGNIILLNPKKTFVKEWLELDATDFKRFLIEYAGEHWEQNNSLVEWKWNKSVVLSGLYFLQAFLLVVWVVANRL